MPPHRVRPRAVCAQRTFRAEGLKITGQVHKRDRVNRSTVSVSTRICSPTHGINVASVPSADEPCAVARLACGDSYAVPKMSKIANMCSMREESPSILAWCVCESRAGDLNLGANSATVADFNRQGAFANQRRRLAHSIVIAGQRRIRPFQRVIGGQEPRNPDPARSAGPAFSRRSPLNAASPPARFAPQRHLGRLDIEVLGKPHHVDRDASSVRQNSGSDHPCPRAT